MSNTPPRPLPEVHPADAGSTPPANPVDTLPVPPSFYPVSVQAIAAPALSSLAPGGGHPAPSIGWCNPSTPRFPSTLASTPLSYTSAPVVPLTGPLNFPTGPVPCMPALTVSEEDGKNGAAFLATRSPALPPILELKHAISALCGRPSGDKAAVLQSMAESLRRNVLDLVADSVAFESCIAQVQDHYASDDAACACVQAVAVRHLLDSVVTRPFHDHPDTATPWVQAVLDYFCSHLDALSNLEGGILALLPICMAKEDDFARPWSPSHPQVASDPWLVHVACKVVDTLPAQPPPLPLHLSLPQTHLLLPPVLPAPFTTQPTRWRVWSLMRRPDLSHLSRPLPPPLRQPLSPPFPWSTLSWQQPFTVLTSSPGLLVPCCPLCISC